VLTEGDDQQDPIADSARAILDGHIVLSRTLAEQGHYPAIDIEQSISRVMHGISSEAHMAAAIRVKQRYAKYQRSRDLITVGAYAAGSDPQLDQAIAAYPQIEAFLRQGMHERSDAAAARKRLAELGA
jgi:flagellum-specific ATP synthase